MAQNQEFINKVADFFLKEMPEDCGFTIILSYGVYNPTTPDVTVQLLSNLPDNYSSAAMIQILKDRKHWGK